MFLFVGLGNSAFGQSWREVPGGGTTLVADAATVYRGKLYLFGIGIGDHGHYVNVLDGSSWSGWSLVPGGGKTMLADSATVFRDKLYLFGIGIGDHGHYVNVLDGSSWSGWSPVPGGGTTAQPDAAVTFRDRLYLFSVGIGDHGHYVNTFDGANWSGWSLVPGGGTTVLADTAAVYRDRLYLFSIGINDHAHYVNTFDGGRWAGWSRVPGGGTTALSDAATVSGDKLYLFAVGTNDHAHYVNVLDGSTWSGWRPVEGGGTTSLPDTAVAYGGKLHLFGIGATDHHHYVNVGVEQEGSSIARIAFYQRITGTLMCRVPDGGSSTLLPIAHVQVEFPGGAPAITSAAGALGAARILTGSSVPLEIVYDSKISDGTVETRLQVMDDLHSTRRDSVVREGTANGDALDLGVVEIDSPDCEIWRIGVKLIDDYHSVRHASPPAKQLRLKRFSGVVVGGPHAFYDYVVLRSDFISTRPTITARERTLFHEFGHTVRHVADGSEAHWNWDNFRWAYARNHDTTEITNVQYAFNEGWANYWRSARFLHGTETSPHPASYRDWNEVLVANRLFELSHLAGSSDSTMVEVLETNPEAIHSLYDFEQRLFARLNMATPPAPPSCPPLYTDDGATCRRDVEVLTKPSYGRGAGVVPQSCGPVRELDAGLCYSQCKPGFHAVGPVCWGTCPGGYADDGATCRRDAQIISADNSKCPGYDKCGLTFAKGCSTCPEGYSNDGCTCRRDVHIVGKSSYGRGVGTPPTSCGAGEEYDAGLCYAVCKPGFHGVGPVCWGVCKQGYDDHGGTCYRGTSIIVKF
jgi:hypothetical protein